QRQAAMRKRKGTGWFRSFKIRGRPLGGGGRGSIVRPIMTSDPVESHCAQIVRSHDRDHWLISLLVPAEARPHLYALYAFNQEIARIREAVSEPMMGMIRLQWWRETVESAAAGTPREHPVAEALTPLLADGPVSASE